MLFSIFSWTSFSFDNILQPIVHTGNKVWTHCWLHIVPYSLNHGFKLCLISWILSVSSALHLIPQVLYRIQIWTLCRPFQYFDPLFFPEMLIFFLLCASDHGQGLSRCSLANANRFLWFFLDINGFFLGSLPYRPDSCNLLQIVCLQTVTPVVFSTSAASFAIFHRQLPYVPVSSFFSPSFTPAATYIHLLYQSFWTLW